MPNAAKPSKVDEVSNRVADEASAKDPAEGIGMPEGKNAWLTDAIEDAAEAMSLETMELAALLTEKTYSSMEDSTEARLEPLYKDS